jgi:hypothetical protein
MCSHRGSLKACVKTDENILFFLPFFLRNEIESQSKEWKRVAIHYACNGLTLLLGYSIFGLMR